MSTVAHAAVPLCPPARHTTASKSLPRPAGKLLQYACLSSLTVSYALHQEPVEQSNSPYPPAGKMLQYAYLSLTILVALPLTLPIDGTDWAAQFGGWSGGDWAWLVCGGTVVYGEAF